MEIAGIVVGGVSVAALFGTCMETFEYVDNGRKYGADYQKAFLKIAALNLRLARWGQQVHFTNDAEASRSAAATEQATHVHSTLGQIQSDFESAAKASKRYALPQSNDIDGEMEGPRSLDSLADKFRSLALQRQKKTSFAAKTKWALRDKKKLASLIDDIKEGVESLENLFPAFKAGVLRQAAVEDAAELIQPSGIEEPEQDDVDTIAVLQDVTAEVDPVLGEAISIAAEYAGSGDVIENINTSDQARVELDDYIATGYIGPAPAERKFGRKINNVRTSGRARVRIGKTYGGRGAFDD